MENCVTHEVAVSVVEIFEDNLHDLLAVSADAVRQNLDVCEHRLIGSYI